MGSSAEASSQVVDLERSVKFCGCSIAGIFRFLLLFVLIPSSDLRGRLIRILEGLGGRVGCHMYWALGSQRSLFGWFVVCSVGASRRCYLVHPLSPLHFHAALQHELWNGPYMDRQACRNGLDNLDLPCIPALRACKIHRRRHMPWTSSQYL